MAREDDTRRETRCHSMPSPLGTVYIYSREGRPLRITISSRSDEAPKETYPSPPRVSAVMESIANYFAAKESPGEVTNALLADSRFTPFQKKVYAVVVSIPRGGTLSYGEVADRAGFPGAARAVGAAMRRNPFPILIPCHRVIRGDGRLGGYSGPPEAKRRLLEREGLAIDHSSGEPRLKSGGS